MFFSRYKDLLFEVTTGPAPSFVFTLSLSFDYNVSTKDYVMPSEPRWQMTPMEYATFLNSSKGDDSGKCFAQLTPHSAPASSVSSSSSSSSPLSLKQSDRRISRYFVSLDVF